MTVVDNGRGIPVDKHAEDEQVGARSDHDRPPRRRQVRRRRIQGLRRSPRRRRVGRQRPLRWCRVEVRRDGKVYRQEYKRGMPDGRSRWSDRRALDDHGTTTSFLADTSIFIAGLDYNYDALVQWFRETAYLTKGLRITLDRRATDREMTFYFEGGIVSFVRHLNRNRTAVHDRPFYVQRNAGRHGRGRAAVQRQLRRVDPHLRQQHQHDRWRHAPFRLQVGADPHDQRLRQEERLPERTTNRSPARTSARG